MAVELIAPRAQTLWGRPAVANFVLGGLGAGLYVAAVAAARGGSSPAVAVASWLGPLLVLAGFAAVGAEAGRPRRGWRVPARVRTSWISREVWIGGVFVALALAEPVLPLPWRRGLGAVAAVCLALAQGFILRRARGVAAWDTPLMPPLFVLSGLVSGAGLLALLEIWSGRPLDGAALRAVLVLLAMSLFAWVAFLARPDAETFAVGPLRRGPLAVQIIGGGYLAPAILLVLALAAPAVTVPAVAAGAALMIWGQVRAKSAVILEAGQLRPITIPHLNLPRRPA